MDRGVITCLSLSVIVYLNSLRAGFVYDDRRAVLANEDVSSLKPLKALFLNDFWGTPLNYSGSHGSYRPLVTLTFRLTALLTGSPFWYHLTNVALHGVATALVVRFADFSPFKKGEISLMGGLLFALHPIHCEAVAGVVGRADVMSTVFFLAGLLTYEEHQKHRSNLKLLIATLILSIASFLSKEYGITLPVVCFLYDVIEILLKPSLLKGNRNIFVSWVALFLCTAISAIARLWLSEFKVPRFSTADNPIAACHSFSTRTLTFLYLPVFHFGLMLYPRWLSFDWSMDAISPVETVMDRRNMLSATFYAALAIALKRGVNQSESRALLRLLILMIASFLPATNLFAYVGFVAAERILYLPSVAFCLIVTMGFRRIVRRQKDEIRRALALASFLILLASLSWRTYQRNNDWVDEEHLFRSAVGINPPKAYGNLGVIYSQAGRLTEAEWCFKQALNHRPNMGDVHLNLGNILCAQNRSLEALAAYNNAINFRPHLSDALLQKAKVLIHLGRTNEAEKVLVDCLRVSSENQRDLKRHQSAQVSSAVLLAELLTKNVSRVEETEGLLLFARSLSPKEPIVYHRLGELLSEHYRYKEAAEMLLEAAEMNPASVSLAAAAGHALHDAKRDFEAELLFRRAVSLDPSDVSHHVNLGAVLHVQGKLGEAEMVYKRALAMAPGHSITVENLKRLQRSLFKICHLQLRRNETFC